MRSVSIGVFAVCLAVPLFAQDSAVPPVDKKAQKTYQQAQEYLQQRNQRMALLYFRDANREDGGHCLPCQEQMVRIGLVIKDWEMVEVGASGMAVEVHEPKQQAVAHYYVGLALLNEGGENHQNRLLTRAHEEFSKATSLYPQLPDIFFDDGRALAQLHKDDEAKTEFQKYVAMTPESQFGHRRALKFISKPELARANLVPGFAIMTADGRRISPEDLAGKVALVYFWGSSCETCLRSFPRLREIAKKFENQPFVLLSVSIDYNPAVWRSYIEKNSVPGLQYIDGFDGQLAQTLGVEIHYNTSADNLVAGVWQSSRGYAEDIPKIFTIDADGVLKVDKVSDSLDARLQEMIARAEQSEASK
jgi:thiol-disulfide isomerase/thioredoxin